MPRPKFTHRLEYGAYRLIESGLRLLSVRTTVSLGEFLGRIAFHILPKYRHIILRNLSFAYGQEKSAQEINDLVLEVFERNGGNLLSSIRLPFLSTAELRKHVTFHNVELALKTIKEGKGMIILAPHMGNWELLAQTIPLVDASVTTGAFYRKLNNPLMDRLIQDRRSRKGLKLFAKHSSSHALTTFLRGNGVLGILADQRVGNRGKACVFFGKPTTFSPLPPVLAKRAKSSVIGLHCTTTGPDHWDIHITSVPELNTQACADSLEAAWRSSPADVFWFQDRWRLPCRRPLAFLKKKNQINPREITNPLRLLLLHPDEKAPPLHDLPQLNGQVTWQLCPQSKFTPDKLPLLDLLVTTPGITPPRSVQKSLKGRLCPLSDLF